MQSLTGPTSSRASPFPNLWLPDHQLVETQRPKQVPWVQTCSQEARPLENWPCSHAICPVYTTAQGTNGRVPPQQRRLINPSHLDAQGLSTKKQHLLSRH